MIEIRVSHKDKTESIYNAHRIFIYHQKALAVAIDIEMEVLTGLWEHLDLKDGDAILITYQLNL